MTSTATEEPKTNALHGPNLILDVENFGPIAEAKNIEFKPMTVFVGPSNTGKTYLATLLHSFLQAYNNTGFPYIFPIRFAPFVDLTDDQAREFYRLLLSSYVADASDDPRTTEEPTIAFNWDYLPRELQSVLEDSGVKWGDWAAEHTLDFLKDNFQVENLDSLNRHSAKALSRTHIRIFDTHGVFQVNVNAKRSRVMTKGVPLIVFGEHLINSLATHAPCIGDDAEDVRKELARSINRSVAEHMNQFPRSVYLPASRTGMMTTFATLAPTVMRSPRGSSSERETSIRLNRVTRDFLGHLAEAKDHRPHENSSHNNQANLGSNRVADNLEMAVIGGNITVTTREIGIPEIVLTIDELVTPIERASSMVTELAPIVLVLRGHVNSGDLLIIDEPEAHLHPAAQQQMAAALAFMVRSGLRVLITTHSHYMVEQLSAFVNASKLDEETRRRALAIGGALGEEDIYLTEDETAVYSFLPSPEHGGSVVKEIFMGDEYEYGPVDHTDATTDQFNRLQSVLLAREEAESNGLG